MADEGLVVRWGVVRGEGDVVSWMPVAGGELDSEWEGEEGVDGRSDGAAIGDCEGAILVIFVGGKPEMTGARNDGEGSENGGGEDE